MIGCGTQEQNTQDKEGAASNDKTEEVAQNNEEAFPDHDHRRCESRGND